MIYGISSVNSPNISNVRSSSGIKDPGYYYVNGEKVYYEKPAGYIFETDAQFASHGSQTAFSVLYPDGKFPWVEGTSSTEIGNYLAGKAPYQVSPGIRVLEGQYVDDLGRVQPWKAYYDEYGRLIARTDYNAGNMAAGIPDIHYHTYEWGPGKTPYESGSHIEGEYMP